MKCFLAIVGTGLLLAGCGAERDQVNPFNDYPDARTGNVPATGMLTVEGVANPGEPGGQGKYEPVVTSMYSIYDESGRFVKDSTAPTTSLAPGRYLIRVDNDNFKPTPFWVTVESGKTTVVDARTIQTTDGKTLNVD
jgi:hypothetical protein